VRTVIPPQFSGEDLQRLLTLALTAPDADEHRRPDPVPPAIPDVPVAPDPAPNTDAWDERW